MENCGFNSFRPHRPLPPPHPLADRAAVSVSVSLQELENIKKGDAIGPSGGDTPTWPVAELQYNEFRK